ncbi:MAG: AAA family ATPase, partial [Clostridiales bacterium]|nr:AAA family ATPase [Clostridiales bacterium]
FVALGDLLIAIFNLQESHAAYIMEKNGVNPQALANAVDAYVLEDAAKMPAVKRDKESEFLAAYTVNLTELAQNGFLDPLVGREDILDRTVQILCRRLKNNPIHVGDPGVGKTAVVEGLAQRIAQGRAPDALVGAEIYSVDMGALLAGARYRGDFEERMVKLLEMISKRRRPILYLDEIHTVVGAGAVAGGSMDAASIIKPYLARGEIRFIGSTTHEEYKKYLEKDRAFLRRFQRIDISEPTVEECLDILKGIKHKYEEYHHVIYMEDALWQICDLSAKYINDRFLPDKAIDVMDETGAAMNMRASAVKIGGLKAAPHVIAAKDVERTVALMAKIPEKTVGGGEMERLLHLEENLKKQIFGQDAAVEIVTSAIKASRSGLNDPDKPVANLLFVGPTGVGKTEIARQLAALLGVSLERFDMSEYQEKHAVARLIGAPPGYVGYESGGLLTEAIRKRPNAVLLLDEIEKAHPDILNVLLQIMDYGTLTDNEGRKADFRHVVLIMTSNAGAADLNRRLIGFDERSNMAAIDKEVERIFSPEFRNRLDAIVMFCALDEDIAVRVAQKAVNSLAEKLAGKNIVLEVTDRLKDWIAKKGLSQKYGAREIIRVVEQDVKKRLIDEVLFGALSQGGTAVADLEEDAVVIRASAP